MSRLGLLAATVFVVFPLHVGAAPFSGFSVGAGAASHSLDLHAQFDDDLSERSETVRKGGPVLDIGVGGRSRNIHLQGGVRGYDAELEATLFPDDCVKADRHVAGYVQIGYVMGGRNVVYGVMETGSADVTVAREGFDDEEFSADTFAFGIGYKLALTDYIELFVEGVDRTYDDLAVHYNEGTPDEEKKDISLDGTNVTAGFTFRF